MKKLVLATAAACSVAAPAAAAPVVWGANGHSYEYIGQGVDWATARSAALSAGGYLVTITSAAEQAFIFNNVTSVTAWAGGSDAVAQGTTEGNWIWVDGPEAGAAFTYTNWNGGEPNNCCGGEDYLHINWSGDRWNDIPGGSSYGYIIEIGGLAGGVPEPSTWALMILGFGAVGGALRRTRKVRTALTFA